MAKNVENKPDLRTPRGEAQPMSTPADVNPQGVTTDPTNPANHAQDRSPGIAPSTSSPSVNPHTPANSVEGAKAQAKDSRYIMITDPETGVSTKRQDYIMKLVDQGMSRAQIRAKIAEVTDDPKFRYQIVFQATKTLDKTRYPNLNGGHPKKAAVASSVPGAIGNPSTPNPNTVTTG